MKILIAHEKHGHRYFDASTPEQIGKASLKLLKERMEYGYYYLEAPDSKDIIPLDQIQNLPERLRREETERTNRFNRYLKDYEKDKKNFETLKRVIENDEWEMAYKVLKFYSDGEYERIDVEELEKVE